MEFELTVRLGENGYELEVPGDETDPGNYVFVTQDLQHIFPLITLLDNEMEIYTKVETQ